MYTSQGKNLQEDLTDTLSEKLVELTFAKERAKRASIEASELEKDSKPAKKLNRSEQRSQ